MISSEIGLGQAKREEKKISLQVPFLPDLDWSIPKNIEKKNHSGFISNQSRLGQDKKRENKILFWLPFMPDTGWGIPRKIQKTNSKRF